jgi:hypothetical protein
MTKLLSVAATIVGALAFASSASANQPPTASVSKFPVSFSLFDPCTNENVDLSGSAMTVLTTQGDHTVFHSVDIDVTGTGETSGASYREHFSVLIAEQGTDSTGPYAETNPVHSSLITPGGGNDFEVDAIFHITISATGDVATFVNRSTGVCV